MLMLSVFPPCKYATVGPTLHFMGGIATNNRLLCSVVQGSLAGAMFDGVKLRAVACALRWDQEACATASVV